MDLTEKDYELLLDALDAWERQPATQALSDSTLRILTRIAMGRFEQLSEEKMRADIQASRTKSDQESFKRKRLSILLRAKVEIARQAAQQAAISSATEEKQ